MNAVDFDAQVCDSDAYGNVTVKGKTYKGHTIDTNGTIWGPDGAYKGKSASNKQAKALIDEWIK